MKKILIGVWLLISVGSLAQAGEFQCASSSPRHHLALVLADSSSLVDVVYEGEPLEYRLSVASAHKNRHELPLLVTSENGDMILRIRKDPTGDRLLGAVKLRIVDERIPLNCRYLINPLHF